MSYILVGVLLVAGLIVLALVLLKVAGAARRLTVTRGLVNAAVDNEVGMLKARSAALRIALRDRPIVNSRIKKIGKSTKA